ncbi:hypothetical protein [Faecalibacter rhinopitheci]|uniref:Uncharacterized protein n=1 Tax=Faecalibacter rhinopitheci TaxID=2779678 RepID=A0A8J7FWN0_9FLAO|nr:hypothetical protein [Faecalibacter rhinopitheci]MBF0598001.1 hypothetical protein [Faecalibacter rhinopitheci]
MDRETFGRNFFSGLFANWIGKLSNEFIIRIDMDPDDEELIELHEEFVYELKDLLDRYSFDEGDKDDLNNLMNKISPN